MPKLLKNFIISCFAFLCLAVTGNAFGQSVEPVRISNQDTALDLTRAMTIYRDQGDSIQVQVAPGPDDIVRRIEVRASGDEPSGNWGVFALANPTDEQIDRLIVVPHYRLAGSGLIWPDLGEQRILYITPSEGFSLERQASADADVFLITLNPGSVITFVAELNTPNVPKVSLWDPDAYKDTINSYSLYHGILLGIAGLLALFLTIAFVVKGTALFPATAALAWAVLAYIGIDFNFLQRLLPWISGNEATWRAGSEVALSAILLIFLFAYLNLNRWHTHFVYAALVWLIALAGLGIWVIYNPEMAAGIARLSMVATAVIGALLILWLSIVRRYDRAIMLIPSWILIFLWLLVAYWTVTGRLDNDVIQPALAGGLVLIVLVVGFTVMQHAFAGGALQQGLFSDLERKALAVMGAGDIVWDWDVMRDKVATTPDISRLLGSSGNQLGGAIRNWLNVIHGDDRDRFRIVLDTILDNKRGRIEQVMRLRAEDGHYHWFALRARPVIGSDGEIIRLSGTLTNVSESKRAQERLLHDAIYDSLTGLPNRQLFVDRVQSYANLANLYKSIRPTVFVIDFDQFKNISSKLGLSASDTIALTLSRRLARLITEQDSLCRLSHERFAILLVSEREAATIASFAEKLQAAATAPLTFEQHEFSFNVSIGLVTWSGYTQNAEDILRDAELAMYQAKAKSENTIEPFRPSMRKLGGTHESVEVGLRNALERDEISILYHPILSLEDGVVVGFETIVEWTHPQFGKMQINEFINNAANDDLILEIANYVFDVAVTDLHSWEQQFPEAEIFISLNLVSPVLVRPQLANDLRSLMARYPFERSHLKIEIAENILMQNPEQSAALLDRIKSMGIGIVLDHFGQGNSSLSYLVRFPFDIMKLDRTLIASLDARHKIMLYAIIDMAHELGLSVIAEGVENESDAHTLRNAGCEYVQSIIFSAPLNADEARDLIMRHNTQQ